MTKHLDAKPTATTRAKRGHGEGSISQRNSRGDWRGEIMLGHKLNGDPDRRYVYGKTRRDVQNKLRELRQQHGDGTLPEAEKSREAVAGYLVAWLAATKSTVRPKTYKTYSDIVRVHLIPGLGRHKLAALKPDHLLAMYAARLDGGSSPQTVVHMHRVLHRALVQAVKWGYVARNVAALVDPPKVPHREIMPPTPEEVVRLLDTAVAIGDRLAALWTLAAHTGARQGELLALRWSDIYLAAGIVRIDRALTGVRAGVPTFAEPKTTRSRRTVVLTAEAVDALKAHQDRQTFERQRHAEGWPNYDLVFTTKVGTPLDGPNVLKLFRGALTGASIPTSIRFHDLRHAAISVMLQAGVPIVAVSEMVGHHSAAMTLSRYGHLLPGAKQSAADKLGEALRSARAAAV